MVTKCQAHRLDDQRTNAPSTNQIDCADPASDEDLFDMLWSLQGCRIEDQRSVMMEPPPHIMTESRQSAGQSQEELFDMILTVQVRKTSQLSGLVYVALGKCLLVYIGHCGAYYTSLHCHWLCVFVC